jgi:perosamine synthetase
MIPQYEPLFNIPDLNTNFVSYINSGGWMTEYKKTEEFENKIKEFLGVKYCSVVNNGTISLSLALLAGGIEPGDEVLVPNITMIATANAVRLIGAIPIFVDISPDTLCMDLYDAFNKLTSKTKALIYVTLNGRSQQPVHMSNFCITHKLLYISDDAQSFGSCYSDGSKIGTNGDISSFSFSMPKIITTG